MIRVDDEAPAAARLQGMWACLATATERPADIVIVGDRLEPMPDAGLAGHGPACTDNSVRVKRGAR